MTTRLWRGSQLVAGVLLPAGGDEALARERVLQLWRPGTRVFATPVGRVVVWETPRRTLCDALPGAALVRAVPSGGGARRRWLLAGAIGARALPREEDLGSVTGEVLATFVGGEAVVVSLLPEQEEDPSVGLALPPLVWRQASALAPREPTSLIEMAPVTSLQEILPNIPGAADAKKAFLAGARPAARENPRGASSSASSSASSAAPSGRWTFTWTAALTVAAVVALVFLALRGKVSLLRAVLVLAFVLGRALLGGRSGGQGASSANPVSAAPTAPASSPAGRATRSLLSRLGGWLWDRTPLWRLVRQQHVTYLREMFAYFENGQWDEALRHAIALEDATLGRREHGGILGFLRAREELKLLRPYQAVGPGLGVGPDLMGSLRALYRRAYEQLARAGRIEEAAWVLSELLACHAEAVAFLEERGELVKAAALAENRRLPPELIVRQWVVAGRMVEAVDCARRHRAFPLAIERLEKRDELVFATKLRAAWADLLLDEGELEAAVRVLWPPTLRPVALGLIDKALATAPDGDLWPRLVARRASVVETTLSLLERPVATILAAEGELGREARVALLEELATVERTPLVQQLARRTLRTTLGSAGEGRAFTRSSLRRYAELGGDPLLSMDIPTWDPPRGLNPEGSGLSLGPSRETPSPPQGLLVYDVALLPRHRVLVALGEMGTRVLARDGSTLWASEEPAHLLVVADNGQRALALSPRDGLYRIAKLDLLARRSRLWCHLALDRFASSYDGASWFVSVGTEVRMLDLLREQPRILWHIESPEAPRRVLALHRSPRHLVVSWSVEDIWLYDVVGPTLRQRLVSKVPWSAVSEEGDKAGPGDVGGPRLLNLTFDDEGRPHHLFLKSPHEVALVSRPGTVESHVSRVVEEDRVVGGVQVGARHIFVAYTDAGGVSVHLHDRRTLRLVSQGHLGGARSCVARPFGLDWILADDTGRLFRLNGNAGTWEGPLTVQL